MQSQLDCYSALEWEYTLAERLTPGRNEAQLRLCEHSFPTEKENRYT